MKKELSEKYTFISESDCEILLPMYQEYGTDMFAMLDAEFACIIYDGETGEFIAARDPMESVRCIMDMMKTMPLCLPVKRKI